MYNIDFYTILVLFGFNKFRLDVFWFVNLFCENLRMKVLSMHFLKRPASGNNEPKKGDTPTIAMDNTELSLWGTRYSWYIVFVRYSLIKLIS